MPNVNAAHIDPRSDDGCSGRRQDKRDDRPGKEGADRVADTLAASAESHA